MDQDGHRRHRTERAVQDAGGRYSPNSSASSGLEDERDFVEASLAHLTFEETSDLQAPQTGPEGDGYHTSYNAQWLVDNDMTPEEMVAHEGTHAGNDMSYSNDGMSMWNLNIPNDTPEVQGESVNGQRATMESNMHKLRKEADRDLEKKRITPKMHGKIAERVDYALGQGVVIEYSTVVNELAERFNKKMSKEDRDKTRSYKFLRNLRDEIRGPRVSGTSEHRSVDRSYRGPVHRTQDAVKDAVKKRR
ncbi:hypothetical protein AB0M35_27355 [Micromonospora sp. NPDC051196]|uniref:hypothetical protein n=1 Tax=Micromonospora sp. NPDC051196 TaxID=3155281 RepID=UPI003432D19F